MTRFMNRRLGEIALEDSKGVVVEIVLGRYDKLLSSSSQLSQRSVEALLLSSGSFCTESASGLVVSLANFFSMLVRLLLRVSFDLDEAFLVEAEGSPSLVFVFFRVFFLGESDPGIDFFIADFVFGAISS